MVWELRKEPVSREKITCVFTMFHKSRDFSPDVDSDSFVGINRKNPTPRGFVERPVFLFDIIAIAWAMIIPNLGE